MKLINVQIRDNYSHGLYGKTVYEERKIMANSKKAAIEEVKQEMFKKTYREFFSGFNKAEAAGHDWINLCISGVLPSFYVVDGGYKYYSVEDKKKMVDELIKDDVTNRIQFFAEIIKGAVL